MDKLRQFLKTAIGAFIGVFIGSSLYTWCGYYFHLNWYAAQAMPWYLLIAIRAGFTAVIVLFLLLLLFLLSRKKK